MAKNKASQQINALSSLVGKTYPRTVSEAVRRGEALAERLQARIVRQKAMLDRASSLMKSAAEECSCGGVEQAIVNAGLQPPVQEGAGNGNEAASDKG